MIYKIISQKYGDMELLDFINKKAIDNILASINDEKHNDFLTQRQMSL